MKRTVYSILILASMVLIGQWAFKNFNFNFNHSIGQPLDSLNGVIVYYNGGVGNITERNLTNTGYNLGLKYQCVEFVKRYYYEYLNHEMPDSYGNAKDFFDSQVVDGDENESRALIQFTNPSSAKPSTDDLVIFGGTIMNRYGHVAIISNVSENEIEIIQQNPGPFAESREMIALINTNGKWSIDDDRVLGWLRKV